MIRKLRFLLFLIAAPFVVNAQEGWQYSEDLPVVLDVIEINDVFKGKWYEYRTIMTDRGNKIRYDYKYSNKTLTATAKFSYRVYFSRPYHVFTNEFNSTEIAVLAEPPTFKGKKVSRFSQWVMEQYGAPDIVGDAPDERHFLRNSDIYEQGDGFIAYIVIDEQGKPSVEMIRNSSLVGFDEKIVKIIEGSTGWAPGVYYDKPVATKYFVVFYASMEYKGWSIKLDSAGRGRGR